MLAELKSNPIYYIQMYALIVLVIALLKTLTDNLMDSKEIYRKSIRVFTGCMLILLIVFVVIHILVSICFLLTLKANFILAVIISFYILGKLAKDA